MRRAGSRRTRAAQPQTDPAEATEGAVSCPLCDGSGEVDEEIAQEFADIWHNNEYVEEES